MSMLSRFPRAVAGVRRGMLSGCMLALLGMIGTGPAAASAEEAFDRGVEAAQAAAYERAVEAFEAARQAGMDTGALHYNLGTAYYGAGELEAARESFRRAWRSETMRAPAAFMLGRIARSQGDEATARTWFRRAHRTAKTADLRHRAERGLSGVSSVADSGYGYAAVGAAHDSNVTASPSDIERTSDVSDQALRASLAGRTPIGGDFHLLGGFYAERFSDLGRFDYTALRGGAAWRETVRGTWQIQLDGQLQHERLGGNSLRDGVVLGAAATRPVTARRRVRLDYEFTAYDADDDFAFLDGHAHQLELATRPRAGAGWLGTLALERMDRDDLAAGNDFQSFSRSAVEVEAGYRFVPARGITLDVGGDLARRDYDGTEVRDGNRIASREDDIAGAWVESTGPLFAGFSWRVRLRHEERHSNVDEFDYERDLLVGYIERVF